jgi:CheY-like chemotaxis protein
MSIPAISICSDGRPAVSRDLTKVRINLEKAIVLTVDDNHNAQDLLNGVLAGFGVAEQVRASNAAEAIDLCKARNFDLILAEANMARMDGFDFVRWLRRSGLKPNAYVPVILLTGHTARAKVEKARDCGANYIVTKPLTPMVLMERIVYVSKDQRPFVECDAYNGPDRRFKNEGPPPGTDGRRKTDLHEELGEATAPNMSQSEIDEILKPTKVRT